MTFSASFSAGSVPSLASGPQLSVTLFRWDNALKVVGVVGDCMQYDLRKDHPEVFIPYAQAPRDGAELIVQSALATTGTLVPEIRKAVSSIDMEEPLESVTTMGHMMDGVMGTYRFPMIIVWVFAALALVLSAVGIFGVISYSVSQRTHEMAIRMAMGAQREDVLKLILGEGLRVTFIGVAIGVAVALGLGRLVANFLYGVRASDPLTFIAVALIMAAVALFAAYIPARRATKVDPMVALRYE